MFDTIPYQIYEFPIVSDSLGIAYSPAPVELKKTVRSDVPDTMGALFVVFAILFLFIAQIVGSRSKMLMSMLDGLWHSKGRQSIFYTATGNEQYSRYVLFTICMILLSAFVYKACCLNFLTIPPSMFQLFVGILGFALLFTSFYCLKWVSYSFVGFVFFQNDRLHQWKVSLFSMICLSGIILFVPVLLYIFVNELALFSYYIVLLYFIVFFAILIYKTCELFFPQTDRLLYLFLYLCAQEIIPLFFFYKIVVYLFNFFCKTTALWL